ncbi:hypothetical protein EVAR_32016_1 [Eumeta japonica]|uniref:Uncharacterized protein n=1 Tax=Eumeta variegata TaxID=151549 RepID=A0A4C1YMM4_EUMVA|nr:hypothetical protein EVAR_32016_1 [Eumeta japonica]
MPRRHVRNSRSRYAAGAFDVFSYHSRIIWFGRIVVSPNNHNRTISGQRTQCGRVIDTARLITAARFDAALSGLRRGAGDRFIMPVERPSDTLRALRRRDIRKGLDICRV